MDGRLETDELAAVITRKHSVLVQLRELSRRQADIIAEGDMNKLLSVLSAKQSLLTQLQSTERGLDPFRHQDPESRTWRSPEDRRRCQQMAERCEALLSEIMLVERQAESDLTARRDDAAARLDGAHHATHARHAYTRQSASHGGQLDVSSQS